MHGRIREDLMAFVPSVGCIVLEPDISVNISWELHLIPVSSSQELYFLFPMMPPRPSMFFFIVLMQHFSSRPIVHFDSVSLRTHPQQCLSPHTFALKTLPICKSM